MNQGEIGLAETTGPRRSPDMVDDAGVNPPPIGDGEQRENALLVAGDDERGLPPLSVPHFANTVPAPSTSPASVMVMIGSIPANRPRSSHDLRRLSAETILRHLFAGRKVCDLIRHCCANVKNKQATPLTMLREAARRSARSGSLLRHTGLMVDKAIVGRKSAAHSAASALAMADCPRLSPGLSALHAGLDPSHGRRSARVIRRHWARPAGAAV